MGVAHVIVCGLGRIGWPVLEYLRAAKWDIVAIDQEAGADDPRLSGARLVRGDFREPAVLRAAGIETAQGVLILAHDDLANLAGTLAARQLNGRVRIVVRLFNENLLSSLKQTLADVAPLSSSRLAAPLLASTALAGDLLASFQAGERTWQIAQLTLDAASPLAGEHLSALSSRFPGVRALRGAAETEERTLRPGAELRLIGSPDALGRLRAAAQGEEALVVRWAGWAQRYLRTIRRTFWEIEWPVRYAALLLFAVILLGSLVFWLSGITPTWAKGLLHTMNIMVTSADLKTSADASTWEEVFIGFLKFSGLFLTAAFTALMTNYLVRARLGGVLNIRKIPESGHIVMCGLGTVGIRVVEQLRGLGAEVVVIERAESTRFVPAARQKGATVLLGDGTLPANLERARTATAQAFIAATSSDLANVEMALLARELNPKLRVVLRLDDAGLAGSLRQTASIRYGLALPHLAAPAFVAPLFGDRVLSLFWLGSVLHAALEIEIEAQQAHLAGRPLEELQEEARATILPLSPAAPDGSLRIGDKLLAILPVERMTGLLTGSGQPSAPPNQQKQQREDNEKEPARQ
jgi:Trk K+ transport system NAD-binding subunit